MLHMPTRLLVRVRSISRHYEDSVYYGSGLSGARVMQQAGSSTAALGVALCCLLPVQQAARMDMPLLGDGVFLRPQASRQCTQSINTGVGVVLVPVQVPDDGVAGGRRFTRVLTTTA